LRIIHSYRCGSKGVRLGQLLSENFHACLIIL
jgi:hypothetical protein